MDEMAQALANSVSEIQNKFAGVLEKLADLRAKPGAIGKDGAQKLAEVEAQLKQDSAGVFATLEDLPRTMSKALADLQAKTEHMKQQAAQLKESGSAGIAAHKAKLDGIMAAQEALAASLKLSMMPPDLSASPELGESLRRHFGLPSAKVSTPFDELPTFESWIGETPSPGSVVYRSPNSPGVPPAASGDKKAPDAAPSEHGFESWIHGSASLARQMLEQASEAPPAQPKEPEIGLNTWLDQSNIKSSPAVPPSESDKQRSEDSRGRFEEWLRRHKADAEGESKES